MVTCHRRSLDFGWYDTDDESQNERIVHALRQNLLDYEEPEVNPPDVWNFGAKTAGMEWAGLGTFGKGMLDEE
jgi:hypothetical protein